MREVRCDRLDEAITEFQKQGYSLDMIMPADSPREAQLSMNSEVVRLIASNKIGQTTIVHETRGEWTTGRAGMMYRDLMPDHLNGALAVSHIRLSEGGAVPDYVHYHKIDFQMIRCIAGRIKVVYEDQGEPFWLEPGDWVVQPPEIRHRVLECEAGSEVIEISMPAEHETWVDHELTLPTDSYLPDREFSGQRFVRHVAPK